MMGHFFWNITVPWMMGQNSNRKHFFWNITVPWMMGQNSNHKHFFWEHHSTLNDGAFFLEHHCTLNDGSKLQPQAFFFWNITLPWMMGLFLIKTKKKKEERMIGQNSNHKHYLISRWVIWDSGANWTQKWTVVINVINLLTSIFKTLVKNLVKKFFYEKIKKIINILIIFFISYKSDVKTFFNWILNQYLKDTS